MNRTFSLVIERKNELLPRVGFSRSTLQSKIHDGLWPPAISLGGDRAVGFLKHETDEMVIAYISGHSKEEIRELVVKLIEERKTLMGANYG